MYLKQQLSIAPKKPFPIKRNFMKFGENISSSYLIIFQFGVLFFINQQSLCHQGLNSKSVTLYYFAVWPNLNNPSQNK